MSDTSSKGNEGRDDPAQSVDNSPQAVTEQKFLHLWLDLEDTVITPIIDGWTTAQLINVDKISDIITRFRPDFLHVFSFAIWNKEERSKFEASIKPAIEEALGMKFSIVPTVDDDILPDCCKVMGIAPSTVDFSEMSAFWNKAGAFRLCMRNMFRNNATSEFSIEVMLLDDVVDDEIFMWPELQVKGCILNIDKI